MKNRDFLKEAMLILNSKEEIYFTKKGKRTKEIVDSLELITIGNLKNIKFNDEEYFTLIFTDKGGLKCAWMSCPISQSENISSKLAKYLFEEKGGEKYKINQARINRNENSKENISISDLT